MASPFSIFRKYSGGLMVILVILSMLLFTLTDLFTDPSANLWLLGMLVGGAVFGIAGIGQGRWLQWGIGGAILGTALGFILPAFTEQGGLDTSLGVIDEEEMYDLEVRRNVANQFVIRAFEASFGEGMGRFARVFGFGHTSPREDVIFGKLLRAEADRLGITVDKAMVSSYLNQITNEKLTKEAYIETRNNLSYQNQRLNDSMLIDILSDEIKAQMAYQLLRPRTSSLPPGPEVYWQYFRRLHVRQQLNLAALDVDEFIDQVEEPADSEVEETFARYARKFPNEDEPGSPGFRLPFRARLAYVELDTESIESKLNEVTDEEIQKYYDDNKETPLIRRPVMPDFDNEKPADEKPADEKPADEKPADEKPADEKPADEKPADEKPADEKPADEKPADEKPADEKPAEEKPAEEKPAEEKPAEDAEPKPEENADGSCGPLGFDEEAKEEAPATVSQSDETSDSPPTETVADEKARTPVSEDKPVATDGGDESPALSIPLSGSGTATEGGKPPAAPDSASDSATPPEPQYEYRELNDELKEEIRQEITRQRVQDQVDATMKRVKAEMETLASQRSKDRFARIEADPGKYEGTEEEKTKALDALREELRPYDLEISAKLKEIAEEAGLAYVETPMISYAELLGEDYPIGRATEPSDNPMFAAESAPVAQTIFQGFSNDAQQNDNQLFQVRLAQRTSDSLDGGSNHYAYWAIDFSPSHIPELSEDGIREMVVESIKRQKARELVQKRGETLAEMVRAGLAKEGEDKQNMTAVLTDQTVTGQADGAPLSVRTSLPFAWMKQSTASPMSFQRQPATMSRIEFDDAVGGALEMVGEDFMRSVFDEMVDEEVAVVPNANLSKYYVVQVTNRFPTPELGEDGLRERFANEGKQFAFAQSPIIDVMQRDLAGPAGIAWERALWKQYGVDPDGEPEE